MEFSSPEKFWFNMMSSIQVRILFFTKGGKIPPLSLNKLSKKSRVAILFRRFYRQAIIKILLAYSLRKLFFIGQNLKLVHVTYSVCEL